MLRLAQLKTILLTQTEKHQNINRPLKTVLDSYSNFDFLVFNNPYKEQVREMCIQEFSQHYPLTTAFVKFEKKETGKQIETRFWNNYIDELANNGLSVIAVDRQTDQVAGAVLAMDYLKFQSLHDDQNPSFYDYSLGSLRDHLFNLCPLEFQELMMEEGKVIQHFALVVKSSLNSRGIMKHMMKAGLKLSQELGYEYVFIHPTNCISEHLCKKNNFTLLAECQSQNFWSKNTRPFQLVDNKHKRATFYIKKI